MNVSTHGQSLVKLSRFQFVNAYLVRESDGFTLIDTMIGGSAPTILQAAQRLGHPIRRIVLTHAHDDHVGSLDALHAALPDAEVLISARDARLLRGDTSLDAGEPAGKVTFRATTTVPTRLLQPGDRVGSLEVIAAPGHTPGQIALLDTRDRTLIVGDAYQTMSGVRASSDARTLFALPALVTWSRPTATRTARALMELKPSRLAVGHGRVVEQPTERMRQAVEKVERQEARKSAAGSA